MSNNIIKFTDFVTFDPSQKVAKLTKREKIKTIDNLITSANTNGKGLVITYDLSHSGRRINNRIYSVKGQQKGIASLTNPYNKPIIRHHDQSTDPIGRFIGGEWQDLESEYMSILKNDLSAYNSLRHAFDSDEPEYMYRSLKQFDLLKNKDWTGLGRMRVQANITDKDAIEKFLDGRYLTFSAGSSTNRHVCSICNEDWAVSGPCEHNHGRDYDGETCVFVCGDFEVVEGSVVTTPADTLSQVISIHRADSLEETNKLEDSSPIEVYNTQYLFNKDSENVQTTSSIALPISTQETNETQEDEETDEEIENLDEKTFKVPSGAKGNAQQVLDWKDKHGSEVKGMTAVGWARARQLATKSEIGLSTVKRMAMFNRHRKNATVDPQFKSEPWKDRGYVAWLGWGGTSGIDWAIKISEANNDESEDAERSSPEGKGAKTPAKPSERIKGSKVNEKGSASSSGKSIEVGSVLESLKAKVKEHNEKHGDSEGKKVTLGMLKAVYRRGAGAFSSTHRPGMSRSGWGVARVNAFLKLVRSGSPSNPKYTTDNDLLPSGHPKKSNNKATTNKKDLNMSNENNELDDDLLEPVTEPTQEEQKAHDDSFEDTESIDWFMLDLALNALMLQEDKALSAEARNRLPDDVFCGPDKSFPIPDCAHVTAARRLIGQSKLSESQKKSVLGCVSRKAKIMECDKSEDQSDLDKLRLDYDKAISEIEKLKEKLSEVLDYISKQNITSTNDSAVLQNNDENNVVNQTNNNAVTEENIAEDKKVDFLNKKVENPSTHVDAETVNTIAKKNKLPEFEQNVVDQYFKIKETYGLDSAEGYLFQKLPYLPRGFHPEKINN
jgi:hypothetical protein